MCPIAAAVAPPPTASPSITATRIPSRANASAQAAPTIPAPTMRTSNSGMLMLNAHAERIARIEHEVSFRRHKSRSFDGWENLSVTHPDTSFKDTADDALLLPGLAFLQLAVSVQARQLRTRAGSARRTVIRLTWA